MKYIKLFEEHSETPIHDLIQEAKDAFQELEDEGLEVDVSMQDAPMLFTQFYFPNRKEIDGSEINPNILKYFSLIVKIYLTGDFNNDAGTEYVGFDFQKAIDRILFANSYLSTFGVSFDYIRVWSKNHGGKTPFKVICYKSIEDIPVTTEPLEMILFFKMPDPKLN